MSLEKSKREAERPGRTAFIEDRNYEGLNPGRGCSDGKRKRVMITEDGNIRGSEVRDRREFFVPVLQVFYKSKISSK